MSMMIRNIIYCLALICYVASPLAAQNEATVDDLKKASGLLESRRFKVKMNYSLYETYSSPKSIEDKHFDISVWDAELNMHVEGLDQIHTENKQLYVDHDHKVMILQKVDKKESKKQHEMLSELGNLDSLFKVFKTISLLTSDAERKSYRAVLGTQDMYKFIDITINTKNYTFEKITMYYALTMDDLLGKQFNRSKEKKYPRLEIIFGPFSFPVTKPKQDFTFADFLQKSRGRSKVLPKYKTYNFFDYTVNN